MPTIHWFRRDLRINDNPALLAAIEAARADGDGTVVPLFVIDPALWGPAGDSRRAALADSLAALSASIGGSLVVQHGDPTAVVPAVARTAAATSVHVAADFGRYGSQRDHNVEKSLESAGVSLVRTGSPYAVAPGRVTKSDGTPYRVYTPFYKAWLVHGWRSPAPHCPNDVAWSIPKGLSSEGLPLAPDLGTMSAHAAGEKAALARWNEFRDRGGVDAYAERRNRPDLAGTSVLSSALKWGEVHPRTLLADLGDSEGAEVFRKEIAWREFYADVLHHTPASVSESLDTRFHAMTYNEGATADAHFEAWCAGRTGYPFVDAGMRQLMAEGWMHNRVRMVVASFLIKDLHLPWWFGARWFMRWLRDGDTASNSHGWQWTAGCGTDAAPYFRVFNPVGQGLRFDPDGDYVRRYVPELAHLQGASAHEPWNSPDGYAHDYPVRIVDHAIEREEALARFGMLPPRT